MKLRSYISTLLGVSIFLDLLFIYGVAGSLETDYITMRQAVIKGITACVYLGIAVMLYNRLARNESVRLSKKRRNELKVSDGRGIWQQPRKRGKAC